MAPVCVLAGLAHISTPADAARRAIVIGIDGYEHIPRLNKARNDAKAMAQRLRDLHFEVIVLTDIGKVQFQKVGPSFSILSRRETRCLFISPATGFRLMASTI